MHSLVADIRDAERLATALADAQPELVFHLAAQSLVRRSYREPLATMATNVMGTANLLEAARGVAGVRAVVVVTSDKCYSNDASGRPMTEDGPMGGDDPYSASKGCAELVTHTWRHSFLAEQGVAVGSARAGNVFGGGDWAEDRLFPDLLSAAGRGATAPLRHPAAVRPWQYVLEPVHGYLLLGRALAESGAAFAEGWNFGPDASDALTVREIAARLTRAWDRVRVIEAPEPDAVHEAPTLTLDATKARTRLGWAPAFTLDEALQATAHWYREASEPGADIADLVHRHLAAWQQRCREREADPVSKDS